MPYSIVDLKPRQHELIDGDGIVRGGEGEPGGDRSFGTGDRLDLATSSLRDYLRLGFKIVGVMPDANGIGNPDIFLEQRVRHE